ncbi:outer membrane autotransporter barrel domain-containing protein [Pseudomonas sp. NFACC02]|uniref:autotransporter outer membrane beta-barrel domain-containing protein n=1 Tax=Pseudomonas sp. NFACC02 TaxID=1566250 RepID=UPI0008C22DF7|nr:autotransporter outer membrane beta-barrel domain-containing protein [Pseudomonas sp. NFACC02]SER07243.1 outer membrane autotransporter barrel domain-containing protein [Pseudomonas sp. NFACC02]
MDDKSRKSQGAGTHWQLLGVLCGMSMTLQGVAQEQPLRDLPGAITIPERAVETVDQATGLEYLLHRGSTLNLLEGAVINNIQADGRAGVVNITGGMVEQTIDASTISAAILVHAGTLNATDAMIRSDTKTAVDIVAVDDIRSALNLNNSFVSGAGNAIRVAKSDAVLTATHVLGVAGEGRSGVGVQTGGSNLRIEDNSLVEGERVGLTVTSSGPIPGTGILPPPDVVIIDHSTVVGHFGPAIELFDNGKSLAVATVTLQNNTELVAGNGNLVEVKDKGQLDLIVDDSRLKGDLLAAESARLDVVLQNDARLSGNVTNVNSMTINSDARWKLLADNQVPTLTMGAGRVSFRGDTFNTLTVGELSGRGVFDMRINLDNGAGDMLNVEGTATGFHHVNVENTGAEVVPAEFDALRIIHTESGNAVFELAGDRGRADLGVYSYALEQQGNDWFIVGSGKIISPSTQSALALFSAGPTIWNSELTTLRSRMGEVRGQEQGGGWIRSYGNRFKASLDAGVDYQQKQQGLSFGADAPIPVSKGHLLVGLMGGYSKSDLDMSRGTSGEVDSYYVGAYGTWLSDEGYYLDGVVKLNQFHNASKVAMSDGSKAKGDYSNMAVGGSVEFGKHIKLPDDYFVAPYAQLSSVWVEGNSYTLDNGLQARTRQTQSVLGKVGTTVGRQFTLKDGGVVQPYVRVALAHEFSRSNDVSVNDQRFDNDLFGSRGELGAGVSVSLSERLQVHADFDYMKGEHVEQPWGANLGLRLAF